tara:strand:+ start:71 stop:691 length:621 start_codon:yes stop_codon:yes gene_type:complete
LERLGFETEEYSPHFHTVQFFQTRNKITKYISLQFYNDSNGILQLRGFISSDEVNHILGKFIDLKVNKEYCTIKDFGQKQTISDGIENLNRIGKEKDLDQYVLAILGHIKSIILPFFDMFPDFGALNEFINKLSEREYTDWVHGQSTLKRLILLSLTNDSKYFEYKEFKEQEYVSFVNTNESMWRPYYETFQSLVNYLESESNRFP